MFFTRTLKRADCFFHIVSFEEMKMAVTFKMAKKDLQTSFCCKGGRYNGFGAPR